MIEETYPIWAQQQFLEQLRSDALGKTLAIAVKKRISYRIGQTVLGVVIDHALNVEADNQVVMVAAHHMKELSMVLVVPCNPLICNRMRLIRKIVCRKWNNDRSIQWNSILSVKHIFNVDFSGERKF